MSTPSMILSVLAVLFGPIIIAITLYNIIIGFRSRKR